MGTTTPAPLAIGPLGHHDPVRGHADDIHAGDIVTPNVAYWHTLDGTTDGRPFLYVSDVVHGTDGTSYVLHAEDGEVLVTPPHTPLGTYYVVRRAADRNLPTGTEVQVSGRHGSEPYGFTGTVIGHNPQGRPVVDTWQGRRTVADDATIRVI